MFEYIIGPHYFSFLENNVIQYPVIDTYFYHYFMNYLCTPTYLIPNMSKFLPYTIDNTTFKGI